MMGSVYNRPHGGLTVEVVVAKTSTNACFGHDCATSSVASCLCCVGVAVGWGGLVGYRLRQKGFAVSKNDNFNGTFAKNNPDGDVVINLGGNSSEDTTLEIE